MKKHIIKFIAMILVITANLCACGKVSGFEASYSYNNERTEDSDEYKAYNPKCSVNNESSYDQLITNKIDIQKFADEFATYYCIGTGTLKRVDINFGIECLRKTDDDSLYSVHKVKQGGLLYVFYESRDDTSPAETIADDIIIHWFYIREKHTIDDFKNLVKNKSTFEDVLKIEPSAQIYKNIYDANPSACGDGDSFTVIFYLPDRIYYLSFKKIDDKYIYTMDYSDKKYLLNNSVNKSARSHQYIGRILDKDWFE